MRGLVFDRDPWKRGESPDEPRVSYHGIKTVSASLILGFSLGGVVLPLLFSWSGTRPLRISTALFFLSAAAVGVVWFFSGLWIGKRKSFPVKLFRRISTLCDRFFVGLLKFRESLRDKVIRSYISWNNERVKESIRRSAPRSVLVLLPRCIHDERCGQNVFEEIESCKRCGLCMVKDVLLMNEKYGLPVKIARRSYIAYRYAREMVPDLTIAVACDDRLFKGITKVWEIPSFCVPLSLNSNPCEKTSLNLEELEEALGIAKEKAGRFQREARI